MFQKTNLSSVNVRHQMSLRPTEIHLEGLHEVMGRSPHVTRSHSEVGWAPKVLFLESFDMLAAILCHHLGKVCGRGQGSKINDATNKSGKLLGIGLHP